MRPILVVVSTPVLGQGPGAEDVCEDMSVEELVADSAIQRFNVRVLSRLSGIDEVQGYVAIRAPLKHCAAGEFRPMVRSKRGR